MAALTPGWTHGSVQGSLSPFGPLGEKDMVNPMTPDTLWLTPQRHMKASRLDLAQQHRCLDSV